MIRFAYADNEGRTCIVHTAPELERWAARSQELREKVVAFVRMQSIPPDARDVVELGEDVALPARTFRDAWALKDGAIVHDMDKARFIHMERIRNVRNEKLAALDVETVKAVGANNQVKRASVEAAKQRLRDIPQTLDLSIAETPEALAAIWPGELT